jgi:hypothetical protein
MIKVKSKKEALEWASRCPASDNEIIKIRQVQEFEDFPEDVQKVIAGNPEMQIQSAQRVPKKAFEGTRRKWRAPKLLR